MNKAFVSRAARLDLIGCATHLGETDRAVAERFLVAAHGAFEFLAQVPGDGAPREVRNPRLVGLRASPIRGFRNYLVFYRQTRTGIRIIRVLHEARNIDAILRKL